MTKQYAKVLLSEQRERLRKEVEGLYSQVAKVTDALKACDYMLMELNKANDESREAQLCEFTVEIVKDGRLDGIYEETTISKIKLKR